MKKLVFVSIIGLLLFTSAYSQKDTTIYDLSGLAMSVDVMPECPGGMAAYSRFISTNVHYPADALESGVQGNVIVSIIIEADGTLSNLKVIRGIGSGCDEEALRVMTLSSPWKAAIKDGKPVRAHLQIPIGFHLTEQH
jgi:protein TonB